MRRSLLILAILLIPAIAPLTYPGFIRTLATFLPVYRVADWTWNPLREGGFLAYWLGSLFCKAGLPGTEAVKAIWAISLVLAGAGVFLLSWKNGPTVALLASLLYVYSPFVLAIIYVKGELAEPLFWGLFPWLLAALSWDKRDLWASLAALLVIFLLLIAHPGLAIFALIAGLACSAVYRRWTFILLSLPSLWSFFALNRIIPLEPNEEFFAHFVLPFQLFSAWWGMKASSPGWIEEMPFQLGVMPLTLAFLALPGWAKVRDREGNLALALAVIPMILAMPIASSFWKLTHSWKLLRYPWEILGFAALGLALLGSFSLKYIPSFRDWPVWTGLVILTLLASYRYLEPEFAPFTPRSKPLAIIGNDNAILVECEIKGEIAPGSRLEIELLWQALRPFDRDYSIFVHFLDAQGKKWAQRDQPPLNGERPTSSWAPGELLKDRYPMVLSPDLPEGPFSLAVGIYRWDTGERLKVRGREDGQAVIPLEICRGWEGTSGSGQ